MTGPAKAGVTLEALDVEFHGWIANVSTAFLISAGSLGFGVPVLNCSAKVSLLALFVSCLAER